MNTNKDFSITVRFFNRIINTDFEREKNIFLKGLIYSIRILFAVLLNIVKYKDLQKVDKYVFFIGHGRSGHSLIGALLDAHPNMMVSHEIHFFSHIKNNIPLWIINNFIILNSFFFAKSNYSKGGYWYNVKNQYLGTFSKLKILGDKKGAGTSKITMEYPNLLDNFIKNTNKTILFIHVVRNPLNNIATKYIKRERLDFSLDTVIDNHFKLASHINKIIKSNKYNILTIYHEDFINNPQKELSRILNFLQIDFSDEYLHDCSQIIYKNPTEPQKKIDWTKQQIDTIKKNSLEIDYLKRYFM